METKKKTAIKLLRSNHSIKCENLSFNYTKLLNGDHYYYEKNLTFTTLDETFYNNMEGQFTILVNSYKYFMGHKTKLESMKWNSDDLKYTYKFKEFSNTLDQ
jgi:hypothetical protein